jgi:peptidoglycan/xylan/chitin deacetylase (PgdA/CDA1 family)
LGVFYKEFPVFAKHHDFKSTLFVQGDSISNSGKSLHHLQDQGHELGLHGFHHELWGRSKWFSKEKILPLKNQEAVLKNALNAFQTIGLKAPESFRAPNLVIRPETYSLLKKVGLRYDSSSSVFAGEDLLPQSRKGVKLIPLSASPVAYFQHKGPIPFTSFWVFNAANVWRTSHVQLKAYLETILEFQKLYHVQPHLVFLIHSWEFYRNGKGENVNGYKMMEELMTFLREQFDIEFVPFNALTTLVHDNF